jgi:hypothetical protein
MGQKTSRSGGLKPPFFLVGDFKSPLLEASPFFCA